MCWSDGPATRRRSRSVPSRRRSRSRSTPRSGRLSVRAELRLGLDRPADADNVPTSSSPATSRCSRCTGSRGSRAAPACRTCCGTRTSSASRSARSSSVGFRSVPVLLAPDRLGGRRATSPGSSATSWRLRAGSWRSTTPSSASTRRGTSTRATSRSSPTGRRSTRSSRWSATTPGPTANLGRREPLRLLYAGTLGRKHNPLLLVDLLERLRERGVDAELTVISEGEGADAAGRGRRRAARDHRLRAAAAVPAGRAAAARCWAPVTSSWRSSSRVRRSSPSPARCCRTSRPAGRCWASCRRTIRRPSTSTRSAGASSSPTTHGMADAVAWLEALSKDPERRAELGHRSSRAGGSALRHRRDREAVHDGHREARPPESASPARASGGQETVHGGVQRRGVDADVLHDLVHASRCAARRPTR